MAHLASVGSHAINGVAELHSELLKKDVLRDFYEWMPEKFTNVTNGVTPRRFVVVSNPKLSRLISSRIGEGWIKNLQELKGLEPSADDPNFQKEWQKDQKGKQTGPGRSGPGAHGDCRRSGLPFRHPGETAS